MPVIKFGYRGALVALAATVAAAATSAPAQAYSLYRAVQAEPTGKVTWQAASFGVSGRPPTLSLFHYPDDAAARAMMQHAPCLVKIDLGAHLTPYPGDQAPIGNSEIPVNANPKDDPRAFAWLASFDNELPGHWAISRSELTTASSSLVASRVAAAGFHSLAKTPGSGVTVINGLRPDCAVD